MKLILFTITAFNKKIYRLFRKGCPFSPLLVNGFDSEIKKIILTMDSLSVNQVNPSVFNVGYVKLVNNVIYNKIFQITPSTLGLT